MIDKDKILKQFGRKLRSIRVEQDVSQEALALDAGYDRTYISLLERGQRNPSLYTLCQLSHLLKVEPAELLKGVKCKTSDLI